MAVTFDETTIQRLFGHEAAEDEDPKRLREYYFKSSTFDQVTADLPLRILVGHKGIGKSALFAVAISEHAERNEVAVVVRPDDVLDMVNHQDDFLRMVRQWKVGLCGLVVRKAGAKMALGPAAIARAETSKHPIEELKEIAQSIPSKTFIARSFLLKPRVRVYIDDLDRGWDGGAAFVRRISALFSAARDLVTDNPGLEFRISLRSDVYFLVRTSDESTDKIEGSVVWQSWKNIEIFQLLAKRVETFFGRTIDLSNVRDRAQSDLARYLHPVFEERFRGRGHWHDAPIERVLMSLIRKRPRDLVKLCTLAARDARKMGRSKIMTDNLEHVFEEYSQGRIQDTVNEFRSELPDVERLLLNMRPTRKEKTAKQGYVYSTSDLLKKIRNIEEQGKFLFRNRSLASPRDLASFMYKINFLTARIEDPRGRIERRYFDEQRYLQAGLVDFGFDWEVHPAYRWALQPDNIDDIYATLRLSEV